MRADSLAGMVCLFIACGGVSALLEAAWPDRAAAPKLTPERRVDWAWWPVSAFLTGNLTRALTVGIVVGAALLLGVAPTPFDVLPALVAHPFGIGRAAPVAQVAFALFVGDGVNYWNHRLRHGRWLWPFHAVHHGPVRLDWLSSARIHPVDDLVDGVSVGLVLVALGVPVQVWLATGPFLLFFDMYVHANVALPGTRLRWPRAVLARCVVGPAFHRHHHAAPMPTLGTGARPCNYAGVFPAWDLVFGTFHLPPDAPAAFGTGEPTPSGLLAQLRQPFAIAGQRVAAALDG